ncbi:MAG: elongation factor G [Christensenellales bacterium]
MGKFSADSIRNLALIGHSGEGKTSLAEAMLFNCKCIDRLGKVDDGTSVMDYDPEEINRKISIGLSVGNGVYEGVKFNIIDVPGFFDFEGEMVSALRVCDFAVIVTSACGQLTVGTEKALEYCIANKKPCAIFVNQMDKDTADYKGTFKAINERFPNLLARVFSPLMEDGKMVGFINVLEGKAVKLENIGEYTEIPEQYRESYTETRGIIRELVAMSYEDLMEKFFTGEPFTKEELLRGLKQSVHNATVVPVFCGSATMNVGVRRLMTELIGLMPSAAQAMPVQGTKDGAPVEIGIDASAPTLVQIFKTIADPFVGKLSMFKVINGKVTAGESLYNPVADKMEKTSSLYTLRGKKQEAVDELEAGDIGAFAKLLYTNTGDVLKDTACAYDLPPIEFPSPVISLAVQAVKQGEDEKVIAGLNRLREEDSTFALEKNLETNQMLVSGLGETQLDIICKKLKSKFNVEAKLVNPRIPYRETITKTVQCQGKHKKQSGGHGQYGDCWIRFEPYPDGDFEFAEEVVGGAVPKQYIPAVEKGLRECIQKGVLAGYPMVNLRAVLYDGSYHDVDSSEMAFKIAASIAYKDGCSKAGPILLEPIIKAKIIVPESYMGDILGDLNKRRGRILGMETVDVKQVIEAEVPHSEMFKYATDLRSMTQGRGSFSMEFLRYDPLAPQLAQKVIADAEKENA